MPDSQSMHPLQKRLDVMIQLLLEMVPEAGRTTASKMDRLLTLGCTQSETAHILGKDVKEVTSRVAKLKKRSSKKTQAAAKDSDVSP